MSITKERKMELIKQFGKSEDNSGSVEAQIALLTERIRNITEHLKNNKKDFSGERGLVLMVAQRGKLTKYLVKHNPEKYEKLRTDLGLRK